MRSQSAHSSLSASSHQTTFYLGRRSTPSPLLSSANFGRSSTLITPPSTHTACVESGRQAGWPHVRRGTVENWCRIQQRGWLAPPRRGREESLGCVVHGDAALGKP